MTRSGAILPFALVAALCVPLDAQRQTIASRDALYHWVEAVNAHVPGQPDAAVRTIAAMSYGSRRELNTSFPLFMRVLRERSVVVTRSELERAVTRLRGELRQSRAALSSGTIWSVCTSGARAIRSRGMPQR